MHPKSFLTPIAVILSLLAPAAAVAQPTPPPPPPAETTAAPAMVEIHNGDRLLSAKRTTGILERNGRSNDDFWAVFTHPENKGKIGLFCGRVLVDKATEESFNEQTGSRIFRGAFQCLDPTPAANIGAVITLPIGRGQLNERITGLQNQLEVAKGGTAAADGRATEAATRADDNRQAREDESKANEELRQTINRLESNNLFALVVIAGLLVAVGLLAWQLAKSWYARLKQALDPAFLRTAFAGLMPEFAGLVSANLRQDVGDSNRQFVAAVREEMRDATAVAAAAALDKVSDAFKADYSRLEGDRRAFDTEKSGFALRATEVIGKETWLKHATANLIEREAQVLARKADAEAEGFKRGEKIWLDNVNATTKDRDEAAVLLENARVNSKDILDQANNSRTQILAEADRLRNEAVDEIRNRFSENEEQAIRLEGATWGLKYRAGELGLTARELAAKEAALACRQAELDHEIEILARTRSDDGEDGNSGGNPEGAPPAPAEPGPAAPPPAASGEGAAAGSESGNVAKAPVKDAPNAPRTEPFPIAVEIPEQQPKPGCLTHNGIDAPFPDFEPGSATVRKTKPLTSDGAGVLNQKIPRPSRAPQINEPPAPEIEVEGMPIGQYLRGDSDPDSKPEAEPAEPAPLSPNLSSKIPFIASYENEFEEAEGGLLRCRNCSQELELGEITAHLDLHCNACPDLPWLHSLTELQEHLRTDHPECLENPPAPAKSSYEVLPDNFQAYEDPNTDMVKCEQCLTYVPKAERDAHQHAKCRLCGHVCLVAEIGKHLKEAHWSIRPPPRASDPAPATA